MEAKAVFISLPSSSPTFWVGQLHSEALTLGLRPYIYRGISTCPDPQISNVECEARSDLYAVDRVFVLMTPRHDNELDGEWIIKYLSKLLERGIVCDVGIVATEVKCAVHHPRIPREARFKQFGAFEQWIAHLRTELNSIASAG